MKMAGRRMQNATCAARLLECFEHSSRPAICLLGLVAEQSIGHRPDSLRCMVVVRNANPESYAWFPHVYGRWNIFHATQGDHVVKAYKGIRKRMALSCCNLFYVYCLRSACCNSFLGFCMSLYGLGLLLTTRGSRRPGRLATSLSAICSSRLGHGTPVPDNRGVTRHGGLTPLF